MNVGDTCPKCLHLLIRKDGKIRCFNCGAEYTPGQEIILPLSQVFKVRSKENARIKANESRRVKNKYNYSPKKRKKHSTGFYGVTRVEKTRGKPRGSWRYRSVSNGINIQRVNLKDLERDVKALGGKWEIVDETIAKESEAINRKVCK